MTDHTCGAPAGEPTRSLRAYAVAMGVGSHLAFAAAVAAMAGMMAFGMSRAGGRVPAPWNWPADALLLAQFPLLHSLLLSRRGAPWLGRMAPRAIARPMATTTYATVASLQVLALFLLWTPSGVVWWRAGPGAFGVILALQAGAWVLLLKAIVDAGFAAQVGLLGWRAVARGEAPRYPPMPVRGLFRWTRQPIYAAFALSLWTVPIWTPDQLAVAVTLTAYCLLGPLLKEARFARRYGSAFAAYRAATPYWLPRLPVAKSPPAHPHPFENAR